LSQYEVDCISSSNYILISCWIPAPDLVEDKLRGNDKGEEWKVDNYLRFAEKVFFVIPDLIRDQDSRTG
tara:strand:- start:12 stop:218 length:207 start_codon:yes stop_codon:yes gene_type:complete